ncbi:MAG: ribosome small subunit-dependent GTPase A [Burkholderiaceae bacterium]|nr:ribosome small subunit-dependent GTPase A [Burkholderiaceae bacterium]
MRGAVSQPGLVVACYGRQVLVETPAGTRTVCRMRGKKNDLIVGDHVHWVFTDHTGTEGVIDSVDVRRNLLYRQDERKTKSFAANLDQLIVLLAATPVFSEGQLARALIAAEHAGIASRIVLNKADLPQVDAARARLVPYTAMNIDVITTSMKVARETARSKLAPLLDGKTTMLLGPSGCGKSTLINLMAPGADAQVGEVSRALSSGRHTTTSTRWYWLDTRRTTALIDSPGFQEFGLRQIKASDLSGHMPDLRQHSRRCKFYNCSHRHEPGCGVRAALHRGEISASRMRLYDELWEELR